MRRARQSEPQERLENAGLVEPALLESEKRARRKDGRNRNQRQGPVIPAEHRLRDTRAIRPLRHRLARLHDRRNRAQLHLRTLGRPLPGHKAGQRRKKRGKKDHQLQAVGTFADETAIP